MEKNVVIDILKNVENLLFNHEIYIAKEYVRLEIENLEGVTPDKCKFISKPFHCDVCHNLNCPDNKKEKKQ